VRQIIISEYEHGVEVTLINSDRVLTETATLPGEKLAMSDAFLDHVRSAVSILLYWEARKVREANGKP